jgi:dihydrodipicolinate synthase/N-acetylneuraminate lyase
MSFTPAVAQTLRQALATVVVVPVTPLHARRFEELRLADASADNVSVVKEALAQLGLCRADVRPPGRPLPADVRDEIRAILAGWGLA